MFYRILFFNFSVLGYICEFQSFVLVLMENLRSSILEIGLLFIDHGLSVPVIGFLLNLYLIQGYNVISLQNYCFRAFN